MNERIKKELELLRRYYPDAECLEVGQSHWFRLLHFALPQQGIWNKDKAAVCFELKADYPGAAPYSFYVEGGLRLKGSDVKPGSYEEPAQTPFPGTWGRFSWQHNASWKPSVELCSGSNALNFVRSFTDRLKEGS